MCLQHREKAAHKRARLREYICWLELKNVLETRKTVQGILGGLGDSFI